jgi:GAF domain-containing protein
MVRATGEGEFLNEVCQLIVDSGGYRLAWVGYAGEDEMKSVHPMAQAGFENGYLKALNITWSNTERGRGPTGIAIRTGKHAVCRNIHTDPQFIPWRSEASKRGYSSVIALPLIHRGRTFGALNIYAGEPDAFDPEEIKLLLDLAEDLAYGIAALRTNADHKRAEEALRRAHQELQDFSRKLERKVEQRTEELQRKSAQLIEAERSAERGKMANRVAHELRNPITVIGGFSRRINEKMTEDDVNKNYLKVILSEVEVLENKISEIIRLDDGE